LGGAIRRVARASGNYVLHQAVSSLLAGRFTRGNIVAGIITALQAVSLARGTSAATAAATDGIERLVATAQSSRRAPSATV